MVSIGTRLSSCDNSGVRSCKCIKVLGSREHPGFAMVGDRLVVSVQIARHDKKVRKHDVARGVLARSTSRTIRPNGISFSCLSNSIIILDKKNNPVGTRIFGCVSHELRFRRFIKIISMASSVF